jgi:glycosyltransferase involved in cell wall biosynthesis
VVTVHGILREVHRITRPPLLSAQHLGRWIESFVFNRARNIIAISPYVQRRFAQYQQANLFPIPNAVNEVYFQVERSPAEPKFIFVGSLYPLKGVSDIITAARILDGEGRKAHIAIIGPPTSQTYSEALRKQSQELTGVTIDFLNWQPAKRIAQEFSTSTALVHPSYAENAPMAVAEALCSGLPVIGTPVGAIPDWIDSGETGVIVPVATPEAIAHGMRAFLDDPELSLRMGLAARKMAAQFRAQCVAQATLKCYNKLLDDGRTTEGDRIAGTASQDHCSHTVV